MWNLKKMLQMSICAKEKQIHRHRKHTNGDRRGERKGQGQTRGWDEEIQITV